MSFGLIIFIVVVAGASYGIIGNYKTIKTLKKRLYARRLTPIKSGTPILLVHYTDNASISLLSEWKINDMHIQSFGVFRFYNQQDKRIKNAAALIRVELPFRTKLHLLGIPINSDEDLIDPTAGNSVMEEVVLEGDFPKHFRLYADKSQQVESRYHFDPAAMAFSVDFCRSHNWEIIHDELYFLQSGKSHEDDPTSMNKDIEEFVNQIRPAIEQKNTKLQNKLRTPYGRERREYLQCPVCESKMPYSSQQFTCPKGHGLLVSATKLRQLRKNGFGYVDSTKVKHTRLPLVCPACENKMVKVNYAGGQTVIDSCLHCGYRWIDHEENQKSRNG